MRFSPYDMHEETLTASRWSQDKEIGVVGIFDLTFLAGDVYG